MPFWLAVVVVLLLVTAYATLPEPIVPATARRALPGDASPAPTSTASLAPPLNVMESTPAPFNAADNSLAGVATSTRPMEGHGTTAEAPAADVVIGPDHPFISYVGRFDLGMPERARFDWPGSTIEAAFSGTSVTLLLDPGDNHFNVVVDGVVSHVVPDEAPYHFHVNGALDRHTIRLIKRTEAYAGTVTFRGFVLDEGHRLLQPPARAPRRIEFLGDSITTGYGAAGESAMCTFSRDTQDVQLTYAAVTAEAFEAEFSAIAMSGLGAVRNFEEETSASANPFAAYYPRTLALDSELLWSFTRWPADAVVIYLGTNDFSTTPWPSEESFVGAYVEIMAQVRGHYPQAHIFAMGGPLLFGPGREYVRAAVTQLRTQQGDERVHFVPAVIDLETSEFGCDYHPNAAGHRRIAAQLIPVMAEQLGW